MNTLNFIFALVIARGIVAHPNIDSGSGTVSYNAETIKTKPGDVSKTIRFPGFTCKTRGTVTFTIDSSFNDARPFIFPELEASFKAEIYVVNTASELKKADANWTHVGAYETAKDTAATKEAAKIKKFDYFGDNFSKKQFKAEVLLPKTDDTTKGYTSFNVKVQSKFPIVPAEKEEKDNSGKTTKPAVPAVDVTKTFTFESSAARYIPGLAITAVSAFGYLMI